MPALTPAYRLAMAASTPGVKWWGRLEVEGLEHLPPTGPLLLAGNHDSMWDPVAIGIAAMPVRQIHALAKAQLWKIPVLDKILDGMGQIPIDRGKGDIGALEKAIERLRGGACIGVFPEGTRTQGRELRARSGLGRLAQAVPETEIRCVTVTGTTQIPHFPRNRPRVRIRFFVPEGGGLEPGEDPKDLPVRLLEEIRRETPRVKASWRP